MSYITHLQMEVLLPNDPQHRTLETMVLKPHQYSKNQMLQPFILKTFQVDISKLNAPVTFWFKTAAGTNLNMYFSDSNRNKKPTQKRSTFSILGCSEFEYPRGFQQPENGRPRPLPNNTVVYVSLEADQVCDVFCGLNQYEP